ncbi:ABC transporter [Psychromonas sp. CNPT3]|uniref:ABC transporter permease n=1 Tax=Psychromonas sp. CNPT3 TaxID=314282 RepID=UPI00006E78F7|nr:ABC transporter permease [Psychromonas sp. CNPT3]AGH82090.1 ABC transporter [Psychromonas sp. CNPT3]
MTFRQLLRLEFGAIFSDKSIIMTIFAGVVFYSFLYPLPYLEQVANKQDIVVVDHDNSSLSRLIIRHSDASPGVHIVAKVDSIKEAKKWINNKKAYGLLVIPRDFRRDLLLGKGATLSYAGDASYFLVYSAIAKSLTQVGMDTGKKLQHLSLLAKGGNNKVASKTLNSITLNSLPAFNHSLGYPSYLMPGLFLLILHQTLLIALSILGAGQWNTNTYWKTISPLTLIMVRCCAFSLIYSALGIYYIGYCYYMNNVNLLASFPQVVLLMLPFLLATIMLGIVLSTFFERRDRPTQVFLLVSMPIIFLSGFVWPLILIPAPLVYISQIIPAIPAIKSMLMLNQMGAPWSSIMPLWLQLWGLTFVFFGLSLYFIRRRQKTIPMQLKKLACVVKKNTNGIN